MPWSREKFSVHVGAKSTSVVFVVPFQVHLSVAKTLTPSKVKKRNEERLKHLLREEVMVSNVLLFLHEDRKD